MALGSSIIGNFIDKEINDMKNLIKLFGSLFNQKEEKAKAEVARKEQEEKPKTELVQKEEEEKEEEEEAKTEKVYEKEEKPKVPTTIKKLKFKVGDRVRVTKHGIETGHTFLSGRVVTITSVYENEGRYYAENDRGGGSFITDDYIEELNEDSAESKVIFSHERKSLVMGQYAIYRHFTAPDLDTAIKFLEKEDISAQLFFMVVETPEGSIAKDRMGIYSE